MSLVPGEKSEGAHEERHPPERGKLIDQVQEALSLSCEPSRPVYLVEVFGQAPTEKVEQESHHGPCPVEVARRHDEVEAHGSLGAHDVGEVKVRGRRVGRDQWISIELEKADRGRSLPNGRPLTLENATHDIEPALLVPVLKRFLSEGARVSS